MKTLSTQNSSGPSLFMGEGASTETQNVPLGARYLNQTGGDWWTFDENGWTKDNSNALNQITPETAPDFRDALGFGGGTWFMTNFHASQPKLSIFSSRDGIDWKACAKDPVYTPSDYPTNKLRDPSFIFHDGYFWVAYTCGDFGASDKFHVVRSNDLLNWTLVSEPVVVTGAGTTWAPEWFKDPATGDIHLFVSVNLGSSVWRATADLNGTAGTATFGTWTKVVTTTGDMVGIDHFVAYEDGYYYLMNHGGGQHTVLYRSTTLTGQWSAYRTHTQLGLDLFEGFQLVKKTDGKWRFYGYGITGNTTGESVWQYADSVGSTLDGIEFSTPSAVLPTWAFLTHGTIQYVTDPKAIAIINTAMIASDISADQYGATIGAVSPSVGAPRRIANLAAYTPVVAPPERVRAISFAGGQVLGLGRFSNALTGNFVYTQVDSCINAVDPTSGASADWGAEIEIRLEFSMTSGATSDDTWYFQLGGGDATATAIPLAAKGFGLKIVASNLSIFSHNGTTLTESGTIALTPTRRYSAIIKTIAGAGVGLFMATTGKYLTTATGSEVLSVATKPSGYGNGNALEWFYLATGNSSANAPLMHIYNVESYASWNV